jgi:hypothetical protein
MMRELRRGSATLLVIVAGTLGACGGGDSGTEPDGPGDPTTPASGTFALSTIDTKALPFAVLSDTFYKLEVTAGGAILDTNGTFVLPLTTRETVAGHASIYVDTTTGTWTQNAGVITMTATGGLPTTAAWDGRKLMMNILLGPSQNSYVYTRER